MKTISCLSLDTSLLPPDQQFGAWAAHSANTDLVPITPGPFLARGSLWHAGTLCISDTELDPFVSDRTSALVRSQPTDLVQVVALRTGAVRFEADRRTEEIVAPGLFVRDYSRTSRIEATRLRAVVIYLARAFLEAATGPFGFQGMLPLSAETTLLGETLALVAEMLPQSTAPSADIYARMLRDLLAASLRRAGLLSADGRRRAGRARVEAFIAAAPPGSVTVAGLTAALGMSRSVIFDLFRPHGGVIAYDRERRLRALARDLADPATGATVAELGARHGFLDPSALSRAFRRSFGCTPHEARLGLPVRPDDPLGARIRLAVAQSAG